jgi:Low molecular weight phosphotyrosine protein phosphatase
MQLSNPGTLTRRAVLALSAAVVGSIGTGAVARCRPARVLLVCQFGSVKSAVAREVMKRRAAHRGIEIEIRSRGITPEEHMSPALAVALRAEGVDTRAQPLTGLASTDWRRQDAIVAFDPVAKSGLPAGALDWSDLPSFNSDYARARPLLAARLDAFLDDLRRRC